MSIELQPAQHGFTCVAAGALTLADVASYMEQARQLLPEAGGHFGLLVDARADALTPPEVEAKLAEVMGFFASRGLNRVAHLSANSTKAMQLNRVGRANGTGVSHLSLDGTDPMWPAKAREWFDRGVVS